LIQSISFHLFFEKHQVCPDIFADSKVRTFRLFAWTRLKGFEVVFYLIELIHYELSSAVSHTEQGVLEVWSFIVFQPLRLVLFKGLVRVVLSADSFSAVVLPFIVLWNLVSVSLSVLIISVVPIVRSISSRAHLSNVVSIISVGLLIVQGSIVLIYFFDFE